MFRIESILNITRSECMNTFNRCSECTRIDIRFWVCKYLHFPKVCVIIILSDFSVGIYNFPKVTFYVHLSDGTL